MIDDIQVHRTRADVLPDSMSWTAFIDVADWCDQQGWRHYFDFWTKLTGVNEKITMHYRFEDPQKAMMFKLAWGKL